MPKQVPGRKFILTQDKINQAVQAIQKLNYDLAQKLLKQALNINPLQSKALYLYSICLKQKEQQQKSIQIYQKSFQLNPCYFDTNNNNLQKILSSIKQNYKMSKKFMQNNSTTNDYRWQEIVNLFAKSKDLNTTLIIMKLFEKIKKSDNQYTAHLFSTMGISYYQIGLYDQSLAKYATAIKIKSTQYRYYNNSAILMYIKGQYTKSQQFVAKSLIHNPGYPKSQFILTFSLCKTGRINQALQKINYSINKQNKSTMYHFKKLTILLLYFTQNIQQIQKQLKNLKYIIDNNQDNDQYFWCMENQNILKQCLQFIDQMFIYSVVFDQEWKKYLLLLDNFLIEGHMDKFRIKNQIQKLKFSILEIFKLKYQEIQAIKKQKQIKYVQVIQNNQPTNTV